VSGKIVLFRQVIPGLVQGMGTLNTNGTCGTPVSNEDETSAGTVPLSPPKDEITTAPYVRASRYASSVTGIGLRSLVPCISYGRMNRCQHPTWSSSTVAKATGQVRIVDT